MMERGSSMILGELPQSRWVQGRLALELDLISALTRTGTSLPALIRKSFSGKSLASRPGILEGAIRMILQSPCLDLVLPRRF